MAFPDALRFVLAVKAAGMRVAATSSSQNVRPFLEQIRLDTFVAEQRLDYGIVREGMTLEDLFDAELSGRELARGKPDPMIFLSAAEELGLAPDRCVVIDDSRSGVEAAEAGGMAVVGVAHFGGRDLLARRCRPGGCDPGRGVFASADRGGPAAGAPVRGPDSAPARRPAGKRLDAGLRGLRAGQAGAARGAVHAGQRLLRHARRAPEAEADESHYPGTYLAGVYNRLKPGLRAGGGERGPGQCPELAAAALPDRGRRVVQLPQAAVEDHRLELDMRRGMLMRQLTLRDRGGGGPAWCSAASSPQDKHLAGQATEFTAENWSGRLEVCSGLDGRVVNGGVKRYRDLTAGTCGVLGRREVDAETIDLEVETTPVAGGGREAARTRLLRDGAVVPASAGWSRSRASSPTSSPWSCEQGRPATVEKVVALYTSRDRAVAESRTSARLAVAVAPATSRSCWPGTRARGAAPGTATTWSWTARTSRTADGPAAAHLPPAADRLAAHGAPGRRRARPRLARRGLPRPHLLGRAVHLPVPQPPAAALAAGAAEYRYARLGTARAAARAAGFDGAMFPWQSGSDGREETQQLHLNPKSGRWLPDHSHLQRHVNIADRLQRLAALPGHRRHRVPALHRRRAAARDRPLLGERRPRTTRRTDRYEIHGVMGPDEYHEGYPDPRRAGPRQQRLHQRHGRLGAAAGAADPRGAAPRTAARS